MRATRAALSASGVLVPLFVAREVWLRAALAAPHRLGHPALPTEAADKPYLVKLWNDAEIDFERG